MSFPRYPKYKPSGVEWLGEVPEHWDVAPTKRHFQIVGGGTPSSDDESCWEGDVPWATPADLGKRPTFELASTQRSLTDKGLASCNAAIVPTGSIVLSTRAPIGSVGVAALPLCTNQGCKSLVPADEAWSTYFAFVFASCTQALQLRGKGTTFLELSADELGAFRVPIPPSIEQRAIATFLDRETAKIEALIAEQEKLIELLAEKRQAVISHAVTKGLNPAAPMKPSGVEWLGDVPAHWEVRPLRTVASIVRGASPRPAGDSRYFNGEAVPWVTVAEITKDDRTHLTETETSLTAEGAAASRLFPCGTLLYSNSGATLGVPKLLGIDACANDGVVGFLDQHSDVRQLFLFQFLNSITVAIREKVKQGSGQPNLNTEIVKAIQFAVPPAHEQDELVRWMERHTGETLRLREFTQRAMDLLRERRSALISAAVTGQIDVRHSVLEPAS